MIFADGFEGTDKTPIPEPIVAYYQSCFPHNDCSKAAGNTSHVFSHDPTQLGQLIEQSIKNGQAIILDTTGTAWKAYADHPSVIAINALDEPDRYDLSDWQTRWSRFEAELAEIRALTDKPIFCNFSALATLPHGGGTRHLPNHPEYVAASKSPRTKRRDIPEACDWVGYSATYGLMDLGPFHELEALGRGVLIVGDAYNGWDKSCTPSNCEAKRIWKARQHAQWLDRPRVKGIFFFLQGRPAGDFGTGIESQADLREQLIQLNLY